MDPAITLLRVVQVIAPAVERLTLPDLGDPATWVIHGLITPEEGRRAFVVLQHLLSTAHVGR
jgi:hypothetical protein